MSLIKFVILVAMLAVAMMTQQPVRPFPKPGETPPPSARAATADASRASSAAEAGYRSTRNGADPGDARLACLPGAQFLASCDAGRGQRYYLFGTNATFAEIVAYYKTYLKDGGERVYDDAGAPVGSRTVRRRNNGVSAGHHGQGLCLGRVEGLAQPKPNANPARFVTIIQIVPAPR